MADDPLTINPFEDIQRSLTGIQRGYEVFPDPNQPDRMLVLNPKGRELNVSLKPAEEFGQSGRTWIVQSPSKRQGRVITPEINPTYNTRKGGQISYTGSSSTQNLATLIDQAFTRSKQYGTPVESAFQGLLSVGDPQLGISPAPSLPYSSTGPRPASERKTLGSVGVNPRTDVGRAPYPEEARAIWKNMTEQVGQAGVEGFEPSKIKMRGGVDPGGYGLSFERMNRAHMMLSDKASLLPHIETARIPGGAAGPDWAMANEPGRLVKAPNLTAGVNEVRPYNLENGTVVPIQPGMTTDFQKPSYAYSNVLLPGETEARAHERRRMVFGTHPVPGSATAYSDPQGVKPKFFGTEKPVTIPMKDVSLYDLESGAAKINLRNISHPIGGGEAVSHIGTLEREGQDPEEIKARLGPSTFRHQYTSLVIPKYIDKITGMPAEFNKEMARGQETDVITTDALVKRLKEKTGMPIIQRGGKGMGLEMFGHSETGSALKGFDIKAAEYLTGAEQNVQTGAGLLGVSHFTGELKGTGFSYGFLGGLQPRQMKGLMRDFSKTFEGGSRFLGRFNRAYKDAFASGQPTDIDMERVAQMYADVTGTETMSGQSFGAKVFESTIRAAEPGSKEDIRNLKRYGAGYIPEGTELSTGIWHPQQLEWLKEQWARGQRSTNPDITDEQIQAEFNKNFVERTEGVPGEAAKGGFRELFQVAGKGTHMFMEMLTHRRAEYQHGQTAGFEWLSGLSERFPAFARELGAHIETMSPQGKTQQAAMGLLQYGIFQGQRREEYDMGEALQMPTSYSTLSREKLMNISGFLGGPGAKMSSLEKLQAISKRYFADEPEGNLLYNPETKTFLPNPNAILGSTFKELGVEAAAVARPYVNAMSSLGSIVSPENEFSPQQMADAGMQATGGLYNFVTGMIGGRGEFFKRLLSKELKQVVSGRYAFDPSVGPGETWLPPKLAAGVARSMGFRGGRVGQAVGEIMESGAQAVTARYPQLAQGLMSATNLLRRSEKISRIGEERYFNQAQDPRGNLFAGMSGAFAQEHAGDYDFDPYIMALGLVRDKKTGQLKKLDDPEVQASLTTNQSASQREASLFADEKFRNMVNAPVSQLQDYAEGKDVVGKALAGNKSYNAREAFGVGVQNMLSKTLGMGVGYNPRRGAAASMAAGGYSQKEIAGVLSTIPSLYQPALDKLLKGHQAAGLPIAATFAKSYFSRNEKTGEGLLKLGSNDAIKRGNRTLPDGSTLPAESAGGVTLNTNALAGPNADRMEMLKGTHFLVEQFAKGGDLGKGANARMSPQQVARWFARPGEHEALAEQLGDSPEMWGNQVSNYYQGILGEGGTLREGLEQIYSTPAWGTVLTNAYSKAYNRTTPESLLTEEQRAQGETGEQIEGALKTARQFAGGFSENYQTGLQGAGAGRDIAYRGRGMNLRGMRARAIQSAVNAFGDESIIGKGVRSLARNLNIPFDRPDFDFEMGSEGPAEAEGPASRATNARQQFLDREFLAAKKKGFAGTYEDFEAMQVKSEKAQLAQMQARARASQGQGTGKEAAEELRNANLAAQEAEQEMQAAVGGGGGVGDNGGGGVTTGPAEIPDPRRRRPGGGRTRRPAGTQRVQDESSRIPFYRGETDEVAFSIRPEDAARFGVGGGSQRRRTQQTANRNLRDLERTPLPADVERTRKLPMRVGDKDMGVFIGDVQAYLGQNKGLVEQLDPILSELGYNPPSGAGTGSGGRINLVNSVRSRLEQAFADDPTRLKESLPPRLYNQLLGVQAQKANVNYLMATMDSASGLGGRRKEIQGLVNTPQLQEDLSVGGWFAQAAGGRKASGRLKNPYVTRNARSFEGTDEFQATFDALSDAGIIGTTSSFGEEQMGALRKLMARNPQVRDVLRKAGQLSSGESPENLPSKVTQLGELAKGFTKIEGSGALSSKTSYVEVAADAHERLTKAIKDQAEKAKSLNEVMDTGNKRLEVKARREKQLADLEVRAAESSFVKQSAQQELSQLILGTSPEEATQGGRFTRMASLRRQIAGAEKAEMQAEAGISDVKGEERWGQAARRMLGGFGLMYMRSIGNFATSGWGYGQQEALGMQNQFAAGQFAATGSRTIPFNQQQQLQNQIALQGVNYNPMQGLQMIGAQNPWLRDLYTPAAAGLGTWGYTQFAAQQIGGVTGDAIKRNAGAIGLAAGGLAMAGDIYARSQDTTSLGSRIGRAAGPGGGAPGIFDMLAVLPAAWQGNLGQVQEQAQLSMDTRRIYEEGGNMNWLLAQGTSRGDAYRATAYEMQQRNLNWSPETTSAVTGYLSRTPGAQFSSEEVQRIAEDYQAGGNSEQMARALLGAAGFSAKGMYAPVGGERKTSPYQTFAPTDQTPFLSEMQAELASNEMTAEERERVAAGLQYAQGLQGTRYIEGFGAKTKATPTSRLAIAGQFGAIAGQAAGNIFQAQQAAWYTSQQAGLQYTAPDVRNFVDEQGNAIEYSPQQAQEMEMQAQAQQMAANQRMQLAQNLQTRAVGLGSAGLGAQMYQQMTGLPQGQEWLGNQLFNGNALAVSAAAAGGFDLNQLAGPTTIQGTSLSANALASMDITDQGRLTGLNWGRTSLRMGSATSADMGRNLFGGMDNAAVRAAVGGQQLYAPVTLQSGQQVTSVGGTMGLQQYGNQLNYDYKAAQIGLQRESMGIDYNYYQQLWGLQDQQRALGHGHQMAQFGFQEQGMALQQQGMQQQNANWWQQFGIGQRQTGMQRDWQRQDWAFNEETRGMQWGWKVEDFEENRRFMTGRQRRLAERQMGRETIMHDREGEQMDRQKKRQQEMWDLQDERFELEKKAHIEAYDLQKKQFDLQKERFEENKQYYLDNKRIQDEIIALQRQHWLDQHEQAKKQLDLAEEHAKRTLELQQATDQLQIAMELTKGEMNTMADDALLKWQESIVNLTDGIQGFIDAVNPFASSQFSATTTNSTSTAQYTGANMASSTPPPQIAYMNLTNAHQTTASDIGLTVGGGGRAFGGPVDYGAVTETGERGAEYLINGVVIPANLTQELKRLGVRPGTSASKPTMMSGSLGPMVLGGGGEMQSKQTNMKATVIVQVGNRELKRYIVDTVAEEL